MVTSKDRKLSKTIQLVNIQKILKDSYDIKLSKGVLNEVYNTVFEFIMVAVEAGYQVPTPVGLFRGLDVPERVCQIPNKYGQPDNTFTKPAHRRPNLRCSANFKQKVFYSNGMPKQNKDEETSTITEESNATE